MVRFVIKSLLFSIERKEESGSGWEGGGATDWNINKINFFKKGNAKDLESPVQFLKNKVGRPTLADFQTYHKVTVSNAAWCQHTAEDAEVEKN